MPDESPVEDAPDGQKSEPISSEDAQLRELEEKSERPAGSAALPDVPDWNYKRKTRSVEQPASSDGSMRGLALGLTIAYGFVGPIIAGYLIGLLIDRQTGVSNQWQTWLTLAGVFGGFIFVVFTLNRTSSNSGSGR